VTNHDRLRGIPGSSRSELDLDLRDVAEDNDGKRVALAVSRPPEGPLTAEPRGPHASQHRANIIPKTKNPSAGTAKGCTSPTPFPPAQALLGPQIPRVFWLPLLPTLRPFPEIRSPVGGCGFRPRLQLRGSDGFPPPSPGNLVVPSPL